MKPLFSILFVFFACQSPKDTTADFEKYINQMPEVKSPITFKSTGISNYPDLKGVDKQLLNTFKAPFNDAGILYGKVFTTADYHAIIYILPGDSEAPCIATYTKGGSKIDSLICFNKASSDVDFDCMETATITPDHKILLTDSTTSYKVDDGNRIENSGKLKVTANELVIFKNGTIKNLPKK